MQLQLTSESKLLELHNTNLSLSWVSGVCLSLLSRGSRWSLLGGLSSATSLSLSLSRSRSRSLSLSRSLSDPDVSLSAWRRGGPDFTPRLALPAKKKIQFGRTQSLCIIQTVTLCIIQTVTLCIIQTVTLCIIQTVTLCIIQTVTLCIIQNVTLCIIQTVTFHYNSSHLKKKYVQNIR
jgi:hypothetical protein